MNLTYYLERYEVISDKELLKICIVVGCIIVVFVENIVDHSPHNAGLAYFRVAKDYYAAELIKVG